MEFAGVKRQRVTMEDLQPQATDPPVIRQILQTHRFDLKPWLGALHGDNFTSYANAVAQTRNLGRMPECTVSHMLEIHQLQRELEACGKRAVAAREHMQRVPSLSPYTVSINSRSGASL